MSHRKSSASHHRSAKKRTAEFKTSGAAYNPSPTNSPSVFSYARAGRQTAEGFGGGNRIGKRR